MADDMLGALAGAFGGEEYAEEQQLSEVPGFVQYTRDNGVSSLENPTYRQYLEQFPHQLRQAKLATEKDLQTLNAGDDSPVKSLLEESVVLYEDLAHGFELLKKTLESSDETALDDCVTDLELACAEMSRIQAQLQDLLSGNSALCPRCGEPGESLECAKCDNMVRLYPPSLNNERESEVADIPILFTQLQKRIEEVLSGTVSLRELEAALTPVERYIQEAFTIVGQMEDLVGETPELEGLVVNLKQAFVTGDEGLEILYQSFETRQCEDLMEGWYRLFLVGRELQAMSVELERIGVAQEAENAEE